VVIVLDQVTKQWVIGSFRLGESLGRDVLLQPGPGAESRRLLQLSGRCRRLAEVVLHRAGARVSVWLLLMLRQHAGRALLPMALSLILGGALGNVIDRLRFDAWSIFSISTWPAIIGRPSTWPTRPSPSAWR
jgi:signal peptidase II